MPKPCLMRFMTQIVFFITLTLSSQVVFAADLSYTGCDVIAKAFMQEMAKAYAEKTGKEIKVTGGGATKGIRTVSAGTSDLGGSCRHAVHDLKGESISEEKDVEFVQVAWDAIVIIVNKDNPLENISTSDLKGIFDGQIESWKTFGWEDKRIMLMTREEQDKYSGVEYMLRALVFNDPEYEFRALSYAFKSSAPLVEKLKKSPYAFAVSGVSSSLKEDSKILSLDGIYPSRENIASGRYPLFRPLYLVFNKNSARQQEIKGFIKFVLGDEGQAIISSQGTVTLAEGKTLKPLWEHKKNALGLK